MTCSESPNSPQYADCLGVSYELILSFSRFGRHGIHFSRGTQQNSHFLMRAVKNNNQEWSIREKHSPGLWVLQVDCTVITSPEDPGEESFQKEGESWRGRRTSCSAGVAMLSSLLKQNMNANISSANRWGTLETLCAASFFPSSLSSLCFSFLAMK